jgi:hypothetical protein
VIQAEFDDTKRTTLKRGSDEPPCRMRWCKFPTVGNGNAHYRLLRVVRGWRSSILRIVMTVTKPHSGTYSIVCDGTGTRHKSIQDATLCFRSPKSRNYPRKSRVKPPKSKIVLHGKSGRARNEPDATYLSVITPVCYPSCDLPDIHPPCVMLTSFAT